MATIKDLIANGTGFVGSQMVPQQQKKGGPSLKEVLGIIGDGLLAAGGGNPIYGPAKIRAREQQDQFQQQWNLAERQGQMATDRWMAQEQYKRNNPAPTEFMRNYDWLSQSDPAAAENYKSRQTNDTVWRQGPDGQFYPYDPTPAPTKPVGKLTPIEPTIQNTPSPQLNANGFPSMLTPQQYQATVNALGKQKTDEWMARNNITIGGQ